MLTTVEIYDTTLRDGTQGEGISFSVEDKIKITLKLDKLGFHYVEGGWPGSNPKDITYFKRIQEHRLVNTKIVAFGRTRKPGMEAAEDKNIRSILEAKVSTAAIVGKSWDFHVTRALATSLSENLNMVKQSVAYLSQNGLAVFYDAEHFFDGFKANPEYALATLKAAREGGAKVIVLCDTNGGSLPHEMGPIIDQVKKEINLPLGIHCHNDGELAVANTVAAVQAGASQVQGTINGYGERCGNTNLCSVIPNLTLKCKVITIPFNNLVRLTELARYVSELANMHPLSSQPYVGSSAFAHKGGVHASAILKEASTYEHIDPAIVGNQRRILVSELSGTSNLLYKYKEFNFIPPVTGEENRTILKEIKELEHQGYQFEGAEGSLELRLRKIYQGHKERFKLENLRVIIEKRENGTVYSEATIKITINNHTVHTAAEGNGPVNALDNALRKAIEEAYPEIKKMHLTDYKVRVLDEKDGTGAMVRVLIETGDGQRSWGTVGVSPNIIEASWQALVDSIAYGLLKKEES
ncbi:transferase [Peptococcaceae bacterium SCADC1_2_3]|nr:transferase [Peptococcaceae bacterium SCADC1_2_3]KFI37513.1 transferase [Peptococcaceae bacterium SCADC1_2_3]